MAKKACPVGREEFLAKAGGLEVQVGQTGLVAAPREFSTGSFGWHLSGKATVMLGGQPVTVQVSANIVAVGSKEAGAGKQPAASTPPAPAQAQPAPTPRNGGARVQATRVAPEDVV